MAATSTSDPGRDHLRRIAVIWAVASIVGVILVVFALGPHMPPGRVTAENEAVARGPVRYFMNSNAACLCLALAGVRRTRRTP